MCSMHLQVKWKIWDLSFVIFNLVLTAGNRNRGNGSLNKQLLLSPLVLLSKISKVSLQLF